MLRVVVVRDVPARAVVAGNPGRMINYVGSTELQARGTAELPSGFASRLIRLNANTDCRGTLTVADKSQNLFSAKRFFLVHDVPEGHSRGSHAHRTCEQFLVAVSGEINVALDDGTQAYVVRLVDATVGIYIPPLVWSLQYGQTADAKLLVTCSESYERADYISDYVEFRRLAASARAATFDQRG